MRKGAKKAIMWGSIVGFFAVMFGIKKKDKVPAETPEPDEPDAPPQPELPDDAEPLEPLYVGKRGDPELEALLTELDAALRAGGVDKTLTAAELTKLPKWGKYAIPQRIYWPNLVHVARNAWNPIRRAMDEPLSPRAYRPPDYNAAVGGKPYKAGASRGSAHMRGEAIDIHASSSKARRKLAIITADLFVRRGDELKLGFGAYGKPTPSNVHVDTGWRKRTWRDAQYYIAEAKKVS